MLTTQPQEEITSLKQKLRHEISKLSGASENNIPKYICINNLNSMAKL